jgi:DNA-binding beta-propeller fold protein YncE
MQDRSRVRFTLGAAIALASLAACSNGSSNGAPTRLVGDPMGIPAWDVASFAGSSSRRDAAPYAPRGGGALLFVSDVDANVVDIFAQKTRKADGSITSGIDGPDGMYDDASKNLYVTNTGTSTVLVYPSGSTKASVTYSDGIQDAVDVVVGLDGTVYAANYDLGSGGSIVEYKKGSTTPSLQISLGTGVLGLTLDANNNLYACANTTDGGDGGIFKFAPGSSTGKNLGISLGFCGGLRFDKMRDIVVADQTNSVIDVFPPGKVIAKRRITTNLVHPYHIAFNRSESILYVADYGTKSVHVFKYASGSPEPDIDGFESPLGVATTPQAPF